MKSIEQLEFDFDYDRDRALLNAILGDWESHRVSHGYTIDLECNSPFIWYHAFERDER